MSGYYIHVYQLYSIPLFDWNYRHRNDSSTTVPIKGWHHHDKDKDKGKSKDALAPMWLFLVSGPVIHVLLALHIVIDNDNIRHILHSIVSHNLIKSVCSAFSIYAIVYRPSIARYDIPVYSTNVHCQFEAWENHSTLTYSIWEKFLVFVSFLNFIYYYTPDHVSEWVLSVSSMRDNATSTGVCCR